jgi:uncharacterized membrane protein YhdT
MILLLANSVVKEHFNNNKNENDKDYENNNEYEYEYENENKDVNYTWIIFYYIICFVAAYLSWNINTKLGYPTDVKLACALNAYSFSIFYIIYYLYIVYKK